MKKDHLSIKKVVKILRNSSKIMKVVSKLRKKYKGKDKEN